MAPQHSAPSTQHSAPLGLLGGTFDPPHIAHLLLAECARHQLGLDRVLFLPAGDPWRKTGSSQEPRAKSQKPAVSPAEHRLEMVRLAIEGNPHFALDDRETRRPGPSYTVDTLEELHAQGHTNLVLILGSDALADMPNWKSPDRIRARARLAVAPKPGTPLSTQHSALSTVAMPRVAISSTLIRTRAAAGLPIRYLVPEPVFAYIQAHGLYGGQGSGVRGR